jgi:hypothetical protein
VRQTLARDWQGATKAFPIFGADVQRRRFFNMATSPAMNASFLTRDHSFNWNSGFLAKPSVRFRVHHLSAR